MTFCLPLKQTNNNIHLLKKKLNQLTSASTLH